MNCPKCESTEVDSSGTCLVCGFSTAGADDTGNTHADDRPPGSFTGMIQMDYSSLSGTGEKAELPQWRLDLSRRLQKIRQKREAESAGGAKGESEHPEDGKSEVAEDKETAKPPRPSRHRKVSKATGPTAPGNYTALHRNPTPRLGPVTAEPGELPLFQSLERKPDVPAVAFGGLPPRKTAAGEYDTKEIQALIDSIVARQAADSERPAALTPATEIVIDSKMLFEDRLTLVSRTLAGLVDLLLVAICTGSLIMAADMASGIDIFDSKSMIIYSLLMLSVFFVYSVFFLWTANQTVGMMLTDLRLVDEEERRPQVRQILWRCAGYLLSLLALGAGLLWGCFDRRGRCLHDRLSNTHVVRL